MLNYTLRLNQANRPDAPLLPLPSSVAGHCYCAVAGYCCCAPLLLLLTGLCVGPARGAVVGALGQHAVVGAALHLVVPRPEPGNGRAVARWVSAVGMGEGEAQRSGQRT